MKNSLFEKYWLEKSNLLTWKTKPKKAFIIKKNLKKPVQIIN